MSMTLDELPAVAECSVSGCSYNDHSHCHAAAVTIGGSVGDAECATFIPLGVTNKEANALADPKSVANTPSNPDNIKNAVNVNSAFWVENADQLNQRFNAWAAK